MKGSSIILTDYSGEGVKYHIDKMKGSSIILTGYSGEGVKYHIDWLFRLKQYSSPSPFVRSFSAWEYLNNSSDTHSNTAHNS